MQTFIADFRHAVRILWKTPAFTAAAALTLALGIGVNIAVFSVFHAALVQSLPVRDPGRLVQVYSWTKAGDHFDFSYPLYVDLRDRGAVLEGLAAYLTDTVGVARGDRSERMLAEFVTSNYFQVLGVDLAAGPGFSGADELPGGPKSVVLSHALWSSLFNGDAAIVGQTTFLNGQPFTIVGVAPRGFDGIVRGQRAMLWTSATQFFPLRNRPSLNNNRNSSWLTLVGRLKPGVPPALAAERLSVVLREADTRGPVPPEYSIRLRPAATGDPGLVEGLAAPLQLLMATVALILVIACANVANLILARSHGRQLEIAVRRALGATRGRIARQLITETLVLAVVGGSTGLLLAIWIVDLFELRPVGAPAPLALSMGVQWPIVLFAAVLAVMATLGAGVVPALASARSDLAEVMKRATGGVGSAGRRRTRTTLALVQIALSLVLTVGAGLFLRSLARLHAIEPSLSTSGVVAANVNLTLRGYDEPRGQVFYEQLLARVSRRPGIDAATLTWVLPVTAGGTRINLQPRATTPPIDRPFEADIVYTSPGYFNTFGIPIVRGRDFSATDRATSRPVIVINETLKQQIWSDADPVGESFVLDGTAFEVIGVCRDTKYRSLRESPRATMYQPIAQSYVQGANLVVRTSRPLDETVRTMREEVRALDPQLPLFNVRTLAEHVARSLYVDRMRAQLVSALAALALALAAVGIYGLVSFTTAQRTREIGLRLALGARPEEVMRLVLAGGVKLGLAGVACGLVLAAWLTRAVATQLYGVQPWDPVALAGGSLALLATVVLATLVPALRGMRVDPMKALRYE